MGARILDNTYSIAKMVSEAASPITTLIAAFLGAWFAYKLADKSKQREFRKSNIDVANKALFNTFQMLNHMRLYQKDMIDPFRGNPGIIIMMRPTLSEKQEDTGYDYNGLTFLLATEHKHLLFDLYIEQQRYRETLKAIDYRSLLHMEKVQPALLRGGIREGVGYPPDAIEKALGPLLFSDLKQSTENVVINVDKNVLSIAAVKNKMLNAYKDIFPEINFINFEPM
jgi:hypothetical protein